jgi:hypothetical protein
MAPHPRFPIRLIPPGKMRRTQVRRYAARSGPRARAAMFLLSLLLASSLFAGENPFAQVAVDSFCGRFAGKDASGGENVVLRLKSEGGKWIGSLFFKGTVYSIKAVQQVGTIEGTFGDEESRFTAKSDGDNLLFSAGTFTARLRRKSLPELKGEFMSKRVKLVFQNRDGGINGAVEFKGKQFQFTAADVCGDLEGIFKNGDEAFKFTLANETDGLVFQTGNFSEMLKSSSDLLLKSSSDLFTSADITFQLKPSGGRWAGNVTLKGRSFSVEAASKDDVWEGTYRDGDKNWPFTAKIDGDNLTFTSGTFTEQLKRQKSPQ